MMKKILPLLLPLLLLTVGLHAQTGSLSLRGIVMKNRKAIPDVVVRVYRGDIKVDSILSRRDGKYTIRLALNEKYLIQFYHKKYTAKNISIDTRTTLASNKHLSHQMVIALEDYNAKKSASEMQPVAQLKISATGDLYDTGEIYQKIPTEKKIVIQPVQVKPTPTIVNNTTDPIETIRTAQLQADSIIKQAYYELDSARKVAYNLISDASKTVPSTQKNKVTYIHDTIYIETANKAALLSEKIKENKKLLALQEAISLQKEEVQLRRQDLMIKRLNARTQEDSLKIAEIDQQIRLASEIIENMESQITAAEEKIRVKDLQIQAKNRLLIYMISISVLILIFFLITYLNYHAKQRLAKQLKVRNKELLELSTIVSETDNAVVLYDLEGKLEWANKGFTHMYGYTLSDLEEFKLDNIFLRKDKETSALHFESVLEQGVQMSFESSTPHKSGYRVWAQTTMTPILDQQGKIFKIAAIDSNITQIKIAEGEIKVQKEKLELHNNMTQDSIRYAQTIQAAFLPTNEELNELYPSFLIDKPKDIVSGDFVWLTKQTINNEEVLFIAAVDCTGHGVPGAFMSMIGNRLLTEIVTNLQIHDPAEILNKLNEEVQSALKQDTTENADGMDVCLCAIYPAEQGARVHFSGAQRPLIHYSKKLKTITKTKGDIKTAGGFLSSFIDKKFTSHMVDAEPGDMIYLTSDGIFDQNGPDRRRFGTKRVNAIIKQFGDSPLAQQKQEILTELSIHQGDAEQRDDITFLGIRI